ncbi:MAG: SulP family inorganic anion transporter [Gammaproteobacteria bacterium]|nr:SulP family inorganic anion transporter [Gammaproteobacteria bacterium]
MSSTAVSAFWLRFIPFITWLPQTNTRSFKADLIAGLTGAIVVLPQGVAFATIAGMPPEYGLYAGMVPAIIAALFGSSKHLVSGPTTAASIVMLSSLSVYAEPGTAQYVLLALTLTFMVGVIELAMGLARMGALVNFISHSVIVGFTAGAAILIAAKQLKYFFGIEMERGGHLHDILIQFVQQIGNINPWVTAVSLATIFSGLIVKRWFPRLPYLIASMLTGGILAYILNHFVGNEVTGITSVGALPQSLPPLSMPDFSLSTIRDLASGAFALSLFALTEAISIGRSLGAKSGQRIDGNQEFIGQGLSNIFGSFFSGYVATGSFNRSGLNFQAGAQTPMAAIMAGTLLIGLVVLVAPYAAYLPNAAMAGILFLVAWGLIDFKEIAHILKKSHRETVVLGITFFGALFLELELAIFAGVILSLLMYLEKVSKPRIITRSPDPRLEKRAFNTDPGLPECPQLKILRIDGSIFFGSINHVQETFAQIRGASPEQKHLAIVAEGINFVDMQGGDVLATEAKIRRAKGGGMYLMKVKKGLWDALDRYGCLEATGGRNIFQSKTAAIRGIYQKLDKSVCASCDKRIFLECQQDALQQQK